MTGDARARFSAGAQAWVRYNREPLGHIRCEVTWHNLAPHLPAVAAAQDPPRVLDAGGGSGELALKLVQCGYRVWLMDYAPAMLDQARLAAASLPDDARARLTFCLMSVTEASDAFPPGFFEAITCHTLVEYLPEPWAALATLSGLLCDGGLLSLSFVNRHAEVLRQVWSRTDPAGALDRLADGSFCAGMFDVSGMAYTSEEVGTWLTTLGLTVTATYGVRAFADYLPRERLDDPRFLDAVLRLELATTNTPPFRQIARYVHMLAVKNVKLS